MNAIKKEKTCLLIAPRSFYSYSEYLKNAINQEGYSVEISNDEYPANNIGKIMGKLRIPLLLTLTSKVICKNYLQGKTYDIVLIIKGRGMSEALLQQISAVSKRIVGYTYDSFKFHDAPLRWYKFIDQFYTFDYQDGAQHQIPVVELFSSIPELESEKECRYEISAIVRNHTDRVKYIHDVLSRVPAEKRFIYIYEKSLYTLIQNFLRNPLLYIRMRKDIHFKPLPYNEYTRVLQQSDFTIDYAHPYQTGSTIRCFEALNCQTKLITNNPNVLKFKHFNALNTIVFNHQTDPLSLAPAVRALKNRVPPRHNRSIQHFIQQLFEVEKLTF